MKKLDEETKTLLKTIYDDCMKEDTAVRERQIRKWRRLKLLWEGFHRIWFSEEAHDWRVWQQEENDQNNSDQAYYDRPINVFRAYLESIIAALSVTVPAIKSYPEDAENPLDMQTAKAGDKIAELIYRHNDVSLLWLHALFIYCTEGLTACYARPHSDKEYGTYKDDVYEETSEPFNTATCPACGHAAELESMDGIDQSQIDICPNCGQEAIPQFDSGERPVQQLVKTEIKPKTRVCMSVYGGLNVKIANYVKCQKDLPYLVFSKEYDYTVLIEEYWELLKDDDDLYDVFKDCKSESVKDQYAMWGRLSPQYQGEYPENLLTRNLAWIRPCKYHILEDLKDVKKLQKDYPDGVMICVIGDQVITAEASKLDDYWTLSEQALADYLHFEPLGESLTSVQDITNDLISLVLQTIEHGIGQTFVSPDIISTKAYSQTEATPGGIYPTKPLGNKRIQDGIFEFRTATLSGEVLPFSNQIQSFGQLASGAQPALFGGQLEGSDTASEYSMSRAQALQRQQNTWRVYTTWWKNIFTKTIPMFIENMKTDEKDVKKDKNGNFVNVLITRSELEGKIGKVELESSENLPMTWGQRKDLLEKLMTTGQPELMQIIGAPENKAILHQYLGLVDFYVPGEDDIIKQYDEIRQLLDSEPIPGPPDPITGQPGMLPSVEIDPIFDNSQIEFEIVRKWIISEEGRQAKVTNPPGYQNVLLHGMQHFQVLQQQVMQQQAMQQPESGGGDGGNPPKPKKKTNQQTPVTGDKDVATVQ